MRNDQIDEAQMAADFATLPDPVNGPMRRARALVEAHINEYGMVPHPDKIKEAIAVELGLAEMRGIDRKSWECMGRKQSLPELGECNWPDCGCDPHATRVIESLLEQGWGPK